MTTKQHNRMCAECPPAIELHNYVAFWVHRLSANILGRFERSLKVQNVTHSQWMVMNTLYCETANVPRELSDVIGIGAGAVSRVVDRLIAKGLLAKHPHPVDRRSVTLTLTPQGSAVMRNLIAIADEQDEAWQQLLTAKERRQLEKTLSKLLEGFGMEPVGRRGRARPYQGRTGAKNLSVDR